MRSKEIGIYLDEDEGLRELDKKNMTPFEVYQQAKPRTRYAFLRGAVGLITKEEREYVMDEMPPRIQMFIRERPDWKGPHAEIPLTDVETRAMFHATRDAYRLAEERVSNYPDTFT